MIESLTPREVEVIDLTVEGLTNKEIGHKLGCAERTVETHLGNLFSKLDCHTRTELARVWVTQGQSDLCSVCNLSAIVIAEMEQLVIAGINIVRHPTCGHVAFYRFSLMPTSLLNCRRVDGGPLSLGPVHGGG